MLRTNASTDSSALGQQAAILGWLQIPVEKRQQLAERIRRRKNTTVKPTAGAKS